MTTRPLIWRKIALLLSLVCVFGSKYICAQTQPPAPAKLPPGYMGSESCKDGHAEIYKNFATTPHWKIAFDKRDAATAGGQCESCHCPARAHLQSGDDTAKISSFKVVS